MMCPRREPNGRRGRAADGLGGRLGAAVAPDGQSGLVRRDRRGWGVAVDWLPKKLERAKWGSASQSDIYTLIIYVAPSGLLNTLQ